MSMKYQTSARKLMDTLKRHEGVKEKVYFCPAGYETIGVGRNISESGLGLSEEEIDYLLENDIARCEMELERSFDWYDDLDDVRKQAIINLCFNIGITSLRKFKNANQAMAEKSFSSASLHYMDSKWAKQVGKRAYEICYMIKTGEYYR